MTAAAPGGAPGTPERNATAEALLDATERLLVSTGPSGLTTRRIAEEAGQAHGLIRYHFGSLEHLVVRVVERATERILDRQRRLYAGDEPFVEKWRTAMRYLDEDLTVGTFPKLAGEMLALSWNQPAYRDAIHRMLAGFTGMLAGAVRTALADQGIAGADVEALATLVRTFQLGMIAERLAGVDIGHRALIDAIDGWLTRLAAETSAGDGNRNAS
ncbi:MAG TPA: TetR/AcrR family transcriptional regulator [Acidimicrobiales bacterium]